MKKLYQLFHHVLADCGTLVPCEHGLFSSIEDAKKHIEGKEEWFDFIVEIDINNKNESNQFKTKTILEWKGKERGWVSSKRV